MPGHRDEVGRAPVRILSSATKQILGARLNPRKVLLVAQGIHRDWRGLAVQAGIDVALIGTTSQTELCLHLWGQKEGRIEQLWTYLEVMDRYDTIDDTLEMIYADYDKVIHEGGGALAPLLPPLIPELSDTDNQLLTIDDMNNLRSGKGLQHYDALVLFADEDIDFVQEMLNKLEGEYDLKLVLKDRDLLGGLQFESESVVKLIVERCTRVIVVLSPEFMESSANRYFTLFAHALSVDQRRRIVIPCLHKPCVKPAVISFCHSLDYYRAKGFWDYWGKLRDSLVWQPQDTQSRVSTEEQPRIREISGSSTSSQLSVASPTEITPSPTQPMSFFSKLLRRSEGKGKDQPLPALESQISSSSTTSVETNSSERGEEKICANSNGHVRSSAIPINESSAGPVLQLGSTSASGESSDYTFSFKSLPDVPETIPCQSPLSTTSSEAMLLPDDSFSSPRSRSRFLNKLFRGKQKKMKIPS